MICLRGVRPLRAAVAVLLSAGAVMASPLTTSPRPLISPLAASQPDALPETAGSETAGPETALIAPQTVSEAPPVLRPMPRPEGLKTALARPQSAEIPQSAPAPRGQLCGVAGIEGREISTIPAKAKGCGLREGVQVTAVSGISLSTPASVDCETAKALKAWVDTGIVPSVGDTGGGVKRLEIAASYVCRPRNNQNGAKISEHGRGRAVDLAGITLKDGRTLTVLQDWKRNPKIMAAIHRSACGTFGTVLGPKSDRFHRDHFHVDTARYRSGSYCR